MATVVVTDLGPCPDCCPVPDSECVACCDPAPPSVLYATLSGLSPSSADACGCFDNSDTAGVVNNNPAGSPQECLWLFNEVPGGAICTSGGGDQITARSIEVECVGGTWTCRVGFVYNFVTNHVFQATGVVETSCDPLLITFTGFSSTSGTPATYCGTLSGITVTVTE